MINSEPAADCLSFRVKVAYHGPPDREALEARVVAEFERRGGTLHVAASAEDLGQAFLDVAGKA